MLPADFPTFSQQSSFSRFSIVWIQWFISAGKSWSWCAAWKPSQTAVFNLSKKSDGWINSISCSNLIMNPTEMPSNVFSTKFFLSKDWNIIVRQLFALAGQEPPSTLPSTSTRTWWWWCMQLTWYYRPIKHLPQPECYPIYSQQSSLVNICHSRRHFTFQRARKGAPPDSLESNPSESAPRNVLIEQLTRWRCSQTFLQQSSFFEFSEKCIYFRPVDAEMLFHV